MKVTRRNLATVLVPAVAALAQAPQTPPALPHNPDEELSAARERVKALGDAMDKEAVPMATEPAFQFKA